MSPQPGGLRLIIRTDGWALLVALGSTVAIELGTFIAARLTGSYATAAMLACLAVSAAWVALASPAFAAGGTRTISCWLRAAAVADASAVTLIVLWLAVPAMTFAAAVKIYCILAAVTLAAGGVIGTARTSPGRCALAAGLTVVLITALASPAWVGGPAGYMPRDAGQKFAAMAVSTNPFFGVMAAVSSHVRQLWTEMTLMYGMTALGDTIPLPPVRWHQPVVIYLVIAAVGLAVSLIRCRLARPPQQVS